MAGFHLGEVEIVVRNGRVRAGYHIGALLDVDVIIHLIGERPGTGSTRSPHTSRMAVTQRDAHGGHSVSFTRAPRPCGIHPKGKSPAIAADEIARSVKRIIEERRSGVTLSAESPKSGAETEVY